MHGKPLQGLHGWRHVESKSGKDTPGASRHAGSAVICKHLKGQCQTAGLGWQQALLQQTWGHSPSTSTHPRYESRATMWCIDTCLQMLRATRSLGPRARSKEGAPGPHRVPKAPLLSLHAASGGFALSDSAGTPATSLKPFCDHIQTSRT